MSITLTTEVKNVISHYAACTVDLHFRAIFNNHELHYITDGKSMVWFYAQDLCEIIGYRKPSDMIRYLPKNDILIILKDDPILTNFSGRFLSAQANIGSEDNLNNKLTFISEPGIYRLIGRSKKLDNPIVLSFQNWLYYEVIPSIRIYGAYISSNIREELINNPNYINELINKLDNYEKQLDHYKKSNYDLNKIIDNRDNHNELMKMANQSSFEAQMYKEQKDILEEENFRLRSKIERLEEKNE